MTTAKPCYSCPKGLMDGYITIHLDNLCRNQCFHGYGGCSSTYERKVMDIPGVIANIEETLKQDPDVRIFLDAPNFLDVLLLRNFPNEPENQNILLLREIIKAGIKPYLRIETTVDSLLEVDDRLDFFDFPRQAGVQEVWLGVESGSPELRDKYSKPSFDNDELAGITKLLHNAGIFCCWYLVVGYEDSSDSISTTEKIIREAQPDRIFLIQLLPYDFDEHFVSLGALILRVPEIEKYQSRLQKIAQELDEKLCKT